MLRGHMGLLAGLALIFGMGHSAIPPSEPPKPSRRVAPLLPKLRDDAERKVAASAKRARKLERNARLAGRLP